MIDPAQHVSPDSLRAVLDHVYGTPAYEWRSMPANPFVVLVELWQAVLEWFARLEQEHPIVHWVVVAVLAAAVVAILAHFVYLVTRALRPRRDPGAAAPTAAAEGRGAGWYRERADRLEADGRYAEALGHRFTATLLELDRRKSLVFHPSKTPAEYVGEARLDGEGVGVLAELVGTLYRHLFGGAPCTAEDARRFRERAAGLVTHGA